MWRRKAGRVGHGGLWSANSVPLDTVRRMAQCASIGIPPGTKDAMKAKQFNEALESLEIESHVAAARILGCGRRSVIRWAQNEHEVPEPVRRLIVMLQQHGIPKEFS